MTQHTTRWLLVTLALLGVVFAAPVAGHAANPTGADTHPTDTATAVDWNGTIDDRAAWMDDRMTAHMGPEGVEWMESRMGLSVDEMTQWMAGDDHPMWDDETPHVTDHETHHGGGGAHHGADGARHRVTDDDQRSTGVDRRGMGGWGC